MHIRIIEGQVPIYPYELWRLQQDFPNTSFVQPLESNDLSAFGVFQVTPTQPPAHNPLTHRTVEAAPILSGGAWLQQWSVVAMTPTQQQAAVLELAKPFTDAMDAMFDQKAQEKRYDNRVTATMRAGYPGPFQAQGIAFATWMDGCNALAYQIMDEVLTGQRPMPTVGELLAMLPAMEWPL